MTRRGVQKFLQTVLQTALALAMLAAPSAGRAGSIADIPPVGVLLPGQIVCVTVGQLRAAWARLGGPRPGEGCVPVNRRIPVRVVPVLIVEWRGRRLLIVRVRPLRRYIAPALTVWRAGGVAL